MTMSPYALAVVNFLICGLIMHVCLCRMNCMSGRVMLRFRSQYAIYFNAALLSAIQPVWGDWPGWGSLALACGILFSLAVTKSQWDGGPPQNMLMRRSGP